jgi:hypothetical protein
MDFRLSTELRIVGMYAAISSMQRECKSINKPDIALDVPLTA